MSDQSPEITHYVAVTRADGSTMVHRSTCSHVKRTKVPTGWSLGEGRQGDEACSRCLTDGFGKAEADRLLEPWADRYAALVVDLEAHCRSLTDDDLTALYEATKYPTPSNCGWSTYRVAPLVLDAISVERYDRSRISTPPGEATDD